MASLLPRFQIDLEAEGSKHITVGLHNDGESIRDFSRRRSGDGDGFVVDVRDLNRRMVEPQWLSHPTWTKMQWKWNF